MHTHNQTFSKTHTGFGTQEKFERQNDCVYQPCHVGCSFFWLGVVVAERGPLPGGLPRAWGTLALVKTQFVKGFGHIRLTQNVETATGRQNSAITTMYIYIYCIDMYIYIYLFVYMLNGRYCKSYASNGWPNHHIPAPSGKKTKVLPHKDLDLVTSN